MNSDGLTRDPGTPPAPRISVTREAAEFAKQKRVEIGKPQAALRVGVKGGGCAGFTYVTDYTEDPPKPRDLVYEFFGLPVYVDTRSLEYIEGSVLEFQNTLMYRGFKFKNPLEDSTCGCGHTFSVKKELRTV
jgi:iron-sulfur cluster assembly protein